MRFVRWHEKNHHRMMPKCELWKVRASLPLVLENILVSSVITTVVTTELMILINVEGKNGLTHSEGSPGHLLT